MMENEVNINIDMNTIAKVIDSVPMQLTSCVLGSTSKQQQTAATDGGGVQRMIVVAA